MINLNVTEFTSLGSMTVTFSEPLRDYQTYIYMQDQTLNMTTLNTIRKSIIIFKFKSQLESSDLESDTLPIMTDWVFIEFTPF